MCHLKRVPAIWFWFVCYSLFVFLCCDYQQVNLFLVSVVELLQVLRNIEAFIISYCSSCVEFIFNVWVKGIFGLFFFMINSCELIFHTLFFLVIKLLIDDELNLNSFLQRIIPQRQHRYSISERILFLH